MKKRTMTFTCETTEKTLKYEVPLQVKEYTLENGLTIWLNEDHNSPKVFGAVVVKAGSKDCPNTGIAHYFEHMMFKGTDKIGTLNYEAEKNFLDQIEAKYDELAHTEDLEERKKLLKDINELNIGSASYVIPNEFNRLITRFGGSGLNAGTSYDMTVYYNTFTPQYIEQWAELNSERLIHPVFRLFQNELETVYEEKSMYGDGIGWQAMDSLLNYFFSPHPYAYPIIGSTEHLKNPRISQIKEFFNKYYVASNMVLLMSGDFNPDQVFPILEQAFSRIRSGQAPIAEKVQLRPIKGVEKIKVKYPVPFIKGMALAFRGIPITHPDKLPLDIAVSMLNNANGTGLLDKLMVDHKLTGAMCINESLNEAGVLAIIIFPKLFFQSYSDAEKLIWQQIDKLRNGEFTDEMFNSLKLGHKRSIFSNIEDIDKRAMIMMSLCSQGRTWEDYLSLVQHIDQITRDDIIRVARQYFSENHIQITKTTGKYPKEHLPKPDFAPVIPTHHETRSAYAKELDKIPVSPINVRYIDLNKDIKRIKLSPLATLYTTHNPVNDIFTMKVIIISGKDATPMLSQLATYLSLVGTKELTFAQFQSQLQSIGTTLAFDVTLNKFIITMSGFDQNLKVSLSILQNFVHNVQNDKKKLKQLIDDEKIMSKSFFKSSEKVSSALLEKIMFGNRSYFMKKLSAEQLKKLTVEELLEVFDHIVHMEQHIHYCGTYSIEEVRDLLLEDFSPEKVNLPSNSPFYQDGIVYSEPTLFIVHQPETSQCIINAYVNGDPMVDSWERHVATMFTTYFGGGMSSLLFQEIREYRSYAYNASGGYYLPPLICPTKRGRFVASLSTQSDKTVDALSILNELIKDMPERPERIPEIREILINEKINDYPSFRHLSERVAGWEFEGRKEDPGFKFIEYIKQIEMKDIMNFYNTHIKNRPIVYTIVGNTHHMDMKRLSTFGKIVKIDKKDLYN